MMGNLQTRERKIVHRILISILASLVLVSVALTAYGQTPGASPQTTAAVSGVIGEVKTIDAAANQMLVRADSGVINPVNLSSKTQYKRMPIGEKSLAKATDITLADVGPGDRVWARWRAGANQKTG